MSVTTPVDDLRGAVVTLDVGAVAPGGHCVARLDGRVVFVRHALPGERVRARLTEASESARFWRADAMAVLGEPSPDRVSPRCRVSGPGGCGGCDWQHASLPAQRRLAGEVVAEQLRRLGGVDVADVEGVQVQAVPGDDDGLAWRTRVRLAVDGQGRAGLRAHRSHQVVPLTGCPLAHPSLALPRLLAQSWPPGCEVVVAGGPGSAAAPSVDVVQGGSAEHVAGPTRRDEVAAGRRWRVRAQGFWQVHPGAADALVAAVREALQPGPGESLLDLYSGVGLFAGSLAPLLAPGGSAVAVEQDALAVRDARRNLHDLPEVRLVAADVARWLRSGDAPATADLVVLDPPRRGAGAAVCAAIARRQPRAVAYVACDPAGLARDVAVLARHGYRLTRLRALHLFPMTHHVECIATLGPLAPVEPPVVG